LATVAHERGSVVGGDARRKAGSRPGRRRLATVLVEVLRGGGFEPQVDPADGTIRLCNCPYDALTGDHRALTCGMNAAWAQGIVDGLGAAATVELAPDPERCCVVFHTASGATGRPRSGGPDPVAS
ncbi:MAG: hypothetical protein ACXWMX_05030, partial [Candidatus Limnocylindrales bacterium]